MSSPRHKSRFWRICRVSFRRFRMVVWLLVLAILAAIVYLNQIGLPGFVKTRLLDNLRARGVDLQFSRLRVRWFEGIVAENVRFGRADEALGPRLGVAEVRLQFNSKALRHFRFQIDSLVLRQGRLVWPVPETPQLTRKLTIEDIHTELRLLADDQWELDHFNADFAGAKIKISGTVTNASAVRDWKFLHARQPTPPGTWQHRLRQLAETIERIHFAAPPALLLDLRGDARDLQSFQIRLDLSAPGGDTPWGTVNQGKFAARLFPASNNIPPRVEISLEAADAQNRSAAITNLHLALHLASVEGQADLIKADLFVSAAQIATEEGHAGKSQITAQWTHTLTNPMPLSASAQWLGEQVETKWGRVTKIRLGAQASKFSKSESDPQLQARVQASFPSVAWWTNLQPLLLDWQCQVTELASPKLEADEIELGGNWCAPELTITNLHARLYQGEVDLRASLNVATRLLDASATSHVDPRRFSSLLTEGGRRWLANYSWNKPPELRGAASVVLPAWTNDAPDWRAEVQPTLRLQGYCKISDGGAFREVPFQSAESHFTYSNLVWHLPDLVANRPEGRIQAELASDDRTKEFYWRIDSTIDPMIMRPLFETNQMRGLDLIHFAQPPVIAGEIWGRWHDPERTTFKGNVAVTNFTIRGESIGDFETTIHYANRYLLLLAPRAHCGEQNARADNLAIDFNSFKIFITNGFGTADPGVVTRAIGPKVARIMEPYHFDKPPTARVQGIIPMRHEEDADLYFQLAGGPFHWWKFSMPHIDGDIHWLGQRLTLSGVRADFYGGHANGSAAFNFNPQHGVDYEYSVNTTNTLLRRLMSALSSHTNHLEGFLNGTLRVTHANSADWRQMNGFGSVDLSDGLIWDIPIFGIFTPVLNGISPGLGTSRASAATASFVINNGVIRSDNLEIRSPALRLQYRGTVDLQGQLNARVEAELMRDVWGLGPVI
ncbi:MAG: hypothetical protein QOJ40_1977, partial [Verrucomicrobiota bacterium]